MSQLDKYDEQIKKLDIRIKQIEKLKEEELVASGKAFLCNKCGRFVNLGDACPVEKEKHICYQCERKIKIEALKKKKLEKLKHSVVVDIKVNDYNTIESFTLYKDGMMVEVDSFCDEGESGITINREWREDYIVEPSEQKPWMKPQPKSQKKIVGDVDGKKK